RPVRRRPVGGPSGGRPRPPPRAALGGAPGRPAPPRGKSARPPSGGGARRTAPSARPRRRRAAAGPISSWGREGPVGVHRHLAHARPHNADARRVGPLHAKLVARDVLDPRRIAQERLLQAELAVLLPEAPPLAEPL